MVSQFVRTGKLKLVYRGLLIIGPNSVIGLRANVAAGLQNKLWNLNEALYANQGKENSGWITSQLVVSLADDVGIDTKKLAGDINSQDGQAARGGAKEAKAYGVGGTPTLEILNPPALPKQLNESSLEPTAFIDSLEGCDRLRYRVRLRVAIAIVALVGLGIAVYLTVARDVAPICTSGGCEKAERSRATPSSRESRWPCSG